MNVNTRALDLVATTVSFLSQMYNFCRLGTFSINMVMNHLSRGHSNTLPIRSKEEARE